MGGLGVTSGTAGRGTAESAQGIRGSREHEVVEDRRINEGRFVGWVFNVCFLARLLLRAFEECWGLLKIVSRC